MVFLGQHVPSAEEANKWYSVTYGNGKFVAVAASGELTE